MNKSLKIFTAAAVTASAIMPVAVSADTTTFSDVVTTNSHFDAITSLAERGIIKGYEDGTYRPNATLTRGQAAKILANTLNLDTSSKEQIFTDVPATLEYIGAINALAKAGVINGYEDGTFKPNAPLTRGQMAKIIVKAYKLEEATELNHSFTDVSNKNGFNYYIQTLLNYGITQGTTATTFGPTEAVKRGQMASFVVRAENAVAAKSPEKEPEKTPEKELEQENNNVEKPTNNGSANSWVGSGNNGSETITGDVVATGDTVTINGKSVAVPANLQAFFANNEEALKTAQMTVVVKNNTITQITSLTLNNSDTSDTLVTFDGAGATIAGDVKINTAKINVNNLGISGNITIAYTVEEINFTAVDVKGSVITEEVPVMARFQRVASLVMFAALENPVTRLKITFANSTVAYMEIKKENVELGFTGTTTVTTVALLADNFTLAKSEVILPNLTISKGVTNIVLNSSIASVEVDSNDDIAISGSGNFASVVVKTDKTVTLNTTGTIAQLASDNTNVTLGSEVKVGATTSIKGEEKPAAEMIANYEAVKEKVNVEINQEEFIKYISAKIVPVEDKYGYVTLSINNGENATIKYRSVSSFDEKTKPVKVGEQAPADAIVYNMDDQFIGWADANIEVYKVDKNNKVVDVFVAEVGRYYTHPLFDLKYENNRFTLTTIFDADAFKKLRNTDFLLEDVMLIDGASTYEFEGFKAMTWSKNVNGLPTVSFDAPADFVYAADNYTNLYIVSNYYWTSTALNEKNYTKEKADQANIALIKSFLEKKNASRAYAYAFESALRSLAYEYTYQYNEEGHIIGSNSVDHMNNLSFVLEAYKKALAAKNVTTAEEVLAIIKSVNEQQKEKIDAFVTVNKDIVELFVEDYHEFPLAEQLAAGVTPEKIEAAKAKLALLGDDIEEMNYLQDQIDLAEGLYNRFVLNLYDFDALKEVLKNTEGFNSEDYSQADWKSFNNAVERGNSILNRGINITQKEIDGAVAYIKLAIERLQPVDKDVNVVDITATSNSETGFISIPYMFYEEDAANFQEGTTVTIDGQPLKFNEGYHVTNELIRQGYKISHQTDENDRFTDLSYISKDGEDVTFANVTSDTADLFVEEMIDGKKVLVFDKSKFNSHIAATSISLKGGQPQTFANQDQFIARLKQIYPDATVTAENNRVEIKSDLIEWNDVSFAGTISEVSINPKNNTTEFLLTFNEAITVDGPLNVYVTVDGKDVGSVGYNAQTLNEENNQQLKLTVHSDENKLTTGSVITLSVSGVKSLDGKAVAIDNVEYTLK